MLPKKGLFFGTARIAGLYRQARHCSGTVSLAGLIGEPDGSRETSAPGSNP